MGRFGYFAAAGAAILGGMVFQGDIDVGSDQHGPGRSIEISSDDDGKSADVDRATKRALAQAVKELVRAEGSLVAAKLDDDTPAAAIKQAEHRRDLAKQAVDRLADDAKAQSRGNRDAVRRNIKDEVRDGVRDAVRS